MVTGSFESRRCPVSHSLKPLDIEQMQTEPRHHREIERVEHIVDGCIAVEDAVLCLAIEHHQQKRKIAPVARTTPHCTLAIDQRKHRYRLAAKRTGSWPSGVPAHADLPDIRVAQPF